MGRIYPKHPEVKRTVISRSNRNGKWEQVVYKWPNGKKTNGKPAFASKTFHERVG